MDRLKLDARAIAAERPHKAAPIDRVELLKVSRDAYKRLLRQLFDCHLDFLGNMILYLGPLVN